MNISRIINSTSDIRTVYDLVADETKKLVPFDRMVVATIDTSRNLLVDRYVAGMHIPGIDIGTSYPLDNLLETEIMNYKNLRWVNESGLREQSAGTPAFRLRLRAGLKSASSFPLVWDDQPIGFLALWSMKPGSYDERDALIVMKVATQISGAVANAELVRSQDREIAVREALSKISRIATMSLDISQVLPEIVSVVQTLMPVDRLVISDVDTEKEVFSLRCSWGGDDWTLKSGETRSLSGSITEPVLGTGNARIIEPQLVEEMYGVIYPGALDPNREMLSWIAAPLRTRSSTIGVIHIRSKAAFAYQETDKRTVEMIASQLAGVLYAQTASERTRTEANERTALAEIGRVISSTLELDEIFAEFA
jgi:transcriptional regulator with GAF, ATPase, and Fis domain